MWERWGLRSVVPAVAARCCACADVITGPIHLTHCKADGLILQPPAEHVGASTAHAGDKWADKSIRTALPVTLYQVD